MTAFAYSVDRRDSHVTLHLTGEVDLAAAPGLESALDTVLDDSDDVVLDIADVTFLDSSGLRVLVAAHNRCSETGKSLTLVNPSAAVSRILEITGLGKTLLTDG